MKNWWSLAQAYRSLKKAIEEKSLSGITSAAISIGALVGIQPGSGEIGSLVDACQAGDYALVAKLSAELVLFVANRLTKTGVPVMGSSGTVDIQAILAACEKDDFDQFDLLMQSMANSEIPVMSSSGSDLDTQFAMMEQIAPTMSSPGEPPTTEAVPIQVIFATLQFVWWLRRQFKK